MKKALGCLLSMSIVMGFLWSDAIAAESIHTVYQVYRPIDLGLGDVPPPKDIFISIGSSDGVRKGSVLDVYRKISSFDNLTQRHMGDHMVPVGRLKVIHSDEKTAIARLDRFVSLEQEPALLPQAIMIGDVVRPISQ